jgi:hypothetical protein
VSYRIAIHVRDRIFEDSSNMRKVFMSLAPFVILNKRFLKMCIFPATKEVVLLSGRLPW